MLGRFPRKGGITSPTRKTELEGRKFPGWSGRGSWETPVDRKKSKAKGLLEKKVRRGESSNDRNEKGTVIRLERMTENSNLGANKALECASRKKLLEDKGATQGRGEGMICSSNRARTSIPEASRKKERGGYSGKGEGNGQEEARTIHCLQKGLSA